jgi:hypothetical protein
MTNKISRLIKRMTEEPFPADGSLYDLGLDDGKLYQTSDGYTFQAVGIIAPITTKNTSLLREKSTLNIP